MATKAALQKIVERIFWYQEKYKYDKSVIGLNK